MAVTVSTYNEVKKLLLNGGLDLDTDTLKMALFNNSASFVATATTMTTLRTNEIANGNGYTTNGATVANKTATQASGTGTFDADDVTWTASGGSITAYKAVLYKYVDGSTGDIPIAFLDFGAVQAAGDGTQFILRFNTSGIYTLT